MCMVVTGKDWGRITGVIYATHVATTMVHPFSFHFLMTFEKGTKVFLYVSAWAVVYRLSNFNVVNMGNVNLLSFVAVTSDIELSLLRTLQL